MSSRSDTPNADMSVGRAARAVRAPPLSPHLGIWRWHITMAASIATRATGMALYVGALIVTAFAVCLAMGPDTYAGYLAVMGSAFGKLVLFGLTVSVFYHLAAGVRHLVWDAGKGFQPGTADRTAMLAFTFGIVASIAVWVIAFMTGAA